MAIQGVNMRICAALVVISMFISLGKSESVWIVYSKENATFQIATSEPKEFVVKGTFENSINKTGWVIKLKEWKKRVKIY